MSPEPQLRWTAPARHSFDTAAPGKAWKYRSRIFPFRSAAIVPVTCELPRRRHKQLGIVATRSKRLPLRDVLDSRAAAGGSASGDIESRRARNRPRRRDYGWAD